MFVGGHHSVPAEGSTDFCTKSLFYYCYFYPPLLESTFTTQQCFLTQTDSRESKLANVMGKQKLEAN